MTHAKGHSRSHSSKPAKPSYKRQQYWVDAALQLQMVGFVLIMVAASLLLTAFSIYRAVEESSIQSHELFHSLEWVKEALQAPLMLSSLISLIASGLLTLFWSHRFAGPLRVISAGIARVRHGNLAVPVRVRTTDSHQDLASEFQSMQEELKKTLESDRSRIAAAIEALEGAEPDASKALDELKKAFTHYHL